mgnify:CR=1 FL=1
MGSERARIRRLFMRLMEQPLMDFPAARQPLEAPEKHGVYVITKGKSVFHVGRTTRAQRGLHQRLSAHLYGRSSFTRVVFNRDGSQLRAGFKFRYLVVQNARHRALLEAYAAGCLCPKHMGVGVK